MLAVKPQSLPLVFPQIAGKLSPDNTVLSIVAGATMKSTDVRAAARLDHTGDA